MKNSVKKQITASMAQASVRTYFVAVSYNGKSAADIPSCLYTVNANSKAVAEARAIAKARAEFPRYSKFMAVAETLTPRKIRRFNREFADARDIVEYLDENLQWYKAQRKKSFDRLDAIISGKTEPGGMIRYRRWQYSLRGDTLSMNRYNRLLCEKEFAWLMMLEMDSVINAK